MAAASQPGNVEPWTRAAATLLIAAMVAGAGCTLCPDPFDYSGPVPNGSPPQNDFRARSGGILSLGAAPKPWPPVVQNAPEAPEAEPPLVDPEDVQVSDEPESSFQQTGGAVSEATGSSDVAGVDRGHGDETGPDGGVPLLSPVPALSAPDAAIDAGGPGDGEPSPDVPAETPGWRARRRFAG